MGGERGLTVSAEEELMVPNDEENHSPHTPQLFRPTN